MVDYHEQQSKYAMGMLEMMILTLEVATHSKKPEIAKKELEEINANVNND